MDREKTNTVSCRRWFGLDVLQTGTELGVGKGGFAAVLLAHGQPALH
jgi:hypothetical protein